MSMFPIGLKVELLINGAWTNITAFVYQRNDITISGGRSSQSDKPPPAQATLTLNNRDGRFTPSYSGGAYYPNLGRNTQIRISVTATSASGNYYTGFRFWGSVPEWPPLQDLSGKDIYVDITASGPMRQVRAGGGKGSALDRYYNSLTGIYAPISYWPCEEDPDTGQVNAGIDAGTPMTVTGGPPLWKGVASFRGSGPIGVLNKSTWDGLTGSVGLTGDDIFTVPGTYTWTAPGTTVDCRCWGPGGNGFDGGAVGGGGGGGGEEAEETSLATTPGKDYTIRIRAGGSGLSQTFAGDSVTVTAHAGQSAAGQSGASGGSGSTNSAHHSGASGGGGGGQAGGGGGSSGGTGAAGNAGAAPVAGAGGLGGSAPGGGGNGGNGGAAGKDGKPGQVPGGGGGGGGVFIAGPGGVGGGPGSGANGGAGKVELVYTPPGAPNVLVVRFILAVPPHGGNNGKVLVRALCGGTIARLDVQYATGGKLKLLGYDNVGAQLFASAAQAWNVDGQAVMVSAELAPSGANVAWTFKAIIPGADTIIGSAAGTVTTASLGNCAEVLAGPNGDITKTGIGHISVQYGLVDLVKVSRALNGHDSEMSVDRFIRLANEQALSNATEFAETYDHFGFRSGTQGWGANNGAVTQSSAWSSPNDADQSNQWQFTVSGTPGGNNYFIVSTAQSASISTGDRFTISTAPTATYIVSALSAPFAGFVNVFFIADAAAPVVNPAVVTAGGYSLLMTCNGAGTPSVFSPTSPQIPVNGGDWVSVDIDVFVPVALTGTLAAQIKWSDGGGATIRTDTGTAVTPAAGVTATVRISGPAPSNAASFNVHWTGSATEPNGRLIYCDNVRVHPRMGPQTRKAYAKFLEEIEDLDQGILREARHLHGLVYKTRIALFNQAPAVTLDYAKAMLSPPLAPVLDDQRTKNDITVHRHKGSKVRKTKNIGPLSVVAPPAGVGRYRKLLKVIAERDDQLEALADHLLGLGTVSDERYPSITVDLRRASIAGNPLAPLMSAVANVEPGLMVKLINLPFFYPQPTAQCLVLGYSEVINSRNWQITWTTVPYSPYVQASGIPIIRLW